MEMDILAIHLKSGCLSLHQLEEGHDFWPSCLGMEHLQVAPEDPCFHYSFMPKTLCSAGLALMEPRPEDAILGSELVSQLILLLLLMICHHGC